MDPDTRNFVIGLALGIPSALVLWGLLILAFAL